MLRIVRNKAAERAKTSYNSSTMSSGGGGSPPPSSAQEQQQQVPPPPPSAHPPPVGGGLSPGSQFSAVSEALLQQRQPSYSINGILGLQQADANANINKRKRDDSGEKNEQIKL